MTRLPDPRLRPPDGGTLIDTYGRVARDLRVSVTDRCSFRCTYCMPAEGLPWLPSAELLTDDELVRVVRVFVSLGVTQVRLTGGEPLLRPSIIDLVRALAEITPRPTLAMTTNGAALARLAAPLAAAGLDRVNVSLDTVDAEQFLALTRRNRLGDVVAGLAAASDAGLAPSRSMPWRCVGSTTTPCASCWPGAWSEVMNCASSSRCPWTHNTAGTGRSWSPPTRSASGWPSGSP
jgi:cyclic pyranopterin phosphate synthase